MWSIRVFILAAICLCATSAAPTQEVAPTEETVQNYRLPMDIMPIHYNLNLTPYLLESDGSKRFTFQGKAEITVEIKNPTNKIVMHTKNLEYTVRQYWDASTGVKITLNDFDFNNVTDIITYKTVNLAAGSKYVLYFEYTGKMDDDMHGFYRSSYVDSKNNTIWLGSTQFQTNHARRAFPSFDEPKFKATFHLTLVRHSSMDTFANTRLINSTSNGDGYYTDVYATTPKMSTYIVAFMVSNFGQRFNGNFGIIARREFYDQSQYSFDVGQELLNAFDNYFGLKYYEQGVNKMHMAAIPDFSAGAMENWGLLTYRERNLLYLENFTTLNAKQAIAAVIAHEQAHMWFGDLVTCDWWSYTWLNEGFARYFQYFGTAWVEKDLHLDQQFVTDQLQTVMNMDSTNNTNPMSDENTNSPADLSRMFNSISYNKGGVFIRMVNHIIGEENFQKSLQEYLNANKYQNTVPKNLFDVWKKYFPEVFKNDADNFFSSYTTQVGYPVVNVELASDGKSFNVSQKRFLLKENDGSDANLLYTIPFTFTTDKSLNFQNTTPTMFLPASKDKITIQLESNVSWIMANIQEMGYYRVNYTEKNWHGIHHALYANNWGSIHELNRAQLVDDLLNLARANQLTYNLALNVLEYLETETHYLPWTAAFNGYNYLAIRLGTNTEHFEVYIRKLTEKAYKKLGFEQQTNDTTLDIYNRAKILSWSCKYGNKDCVSKAGNYFKTIDTSPVPVNIRSVVYCSAMRTAEESDYDRLVQKFKTENVATEQTLILSALGCVKHTKLVDKHFWFIVSDDVRRQDKSSALSSLYSENNENVSPVFKLVTDNCDKLSEVMGGYSAVASVISNIASRFTEESQKKDLEEFNRVNSTKFGSSAATLVAAETTVGENLAWANKNLDEFITYLQRSNSAAAFMNFYTTLTVLIFSLAAMLLR